PGDGFAGAIESLGGGAGKGLSRAFPTLGRRLCRGNRGPAGSACEGAVEAPLPLSGAGFPGSACPIGKVSEGAIEAPSDWARPKEPVTGYTVNGACDGRRDPVRRPRPEWSRHAPGRARAAAPRDTGVRGSWFGAFVARSPALRRTRAETGLP